MQLQLMKINFLQFFYFLKTRLRLSIMTVNPCTIQRRKVTALLMSEEPCYKGLANFNEYKWKFIAISL